MPSKIPSSQVEPSSGPLGLRTSTCRSWPTPGTTSCSSTPSTPPGRSSSCSRRSRLCAASRRRRWCASPVTTPIRSASRLTPGRAASLSRWSTLARRRRPSARLPLLSPWQPQQRWGTRRVGRVQELPRLPRYREQRAPYRADDRDQPVAGESRCHRSVPGVDVLLIGPSDLSIELGVPLDYSCDTYQRALDKIAAAAAKRGIAAGMYFIPPEMDPNFFVQKGFKFFTMPWGPWAKAGIQNGLSEIKR